MTTIMTIKCGNTKTLGTHNHETAAQVRACYGFGGQPAAPVAPAGTTSTSTPKVEDKATEKQTAFIGRLREERNLPATAMGLDNLSKKKASEMISELLAMPKPVPATHVDAAPAAKAETPEGMHMIGEDIFKVQRAVHGSGHLYAKRLVPGHGYGAKAKFEYAPGVLKTLSAATKMSLEKAKAFGALYGTCCVCGRTLTNEESIAAGIGPVCAGKADWFA